MPKPNSIVQMSLEFLVELLFKRGFVGAGVEGYYGKYNDLTQTVEIFVHDNQKAEMLEYSMLTYEPKLTAELLKEEAECSIQSCL